MNFHWFTSPYPGNLGDILFKTLLSWDGIDATCCPRSTEGKILGPGSILGIAGPGDTVWGSGILNRAIRPCMGAKYAAVRGLESIKRLRQACLPTDIPIGDPALLVPRFHPRGKRLGKVAIVPHYVDYAYIRSFSRFPVINVLNADPLQVIDQITGYDFIFSSSLHGLIISDAYGIPNCHFKTFKPLAGDGVKFVDHWSAISLPPYTAASMNFQSDVCPNLAGVAEGTRRLDKMKLPDLDSLWEARPWR